MPRQSSWMLRTLLWLGSTGSGSKLTSTSHWVPKPWARRSREAFGPWTSAVPSWRSQSTAATYPSILSGDWWGGGGEGAWGGWGWGGGLTEPTAEVTITSRPNELLA